MKSEQQRLDARLQAVNRTTLVSATSNLFMSGMKILVGWIGQSHALIADGVHSLSDLASDLLVWFAGRAGAQAPDEEHPYGHGRFETLATLGLGLLLLMVAIGIGWDAAERLFSPEDLLVPASITLYAAGASILINEALFWYTRAWGKRVKSDMLLANAWHHRSDALSSIVVLIGVAGTMAGLSYLDAIASVLVALMIAKVAWGLGWPSVRELVDTGLDPEQLKAARGVILRVDGVRDAHMLRTRTIAGQASADVHILVDPFISVSEGHLISVAVEQALKAQIDNLQDVTVHIDPEDDARARPTMGLPTRSRALARIDELCRDLPEIGSRKRVLLHYLNGHIQVDLFLPMNRACNSEQTPETLAEAVRSRLARDEHFSQVNLYFG